MTLVLFSVILGMGASPAPVQATPPPATKPLWLYLRRADKPDRWLRLDARSSAFQWWDATGYAGGIPGRAAYGFKPMGWNQAFWPEPPARDTFGNAIPDFAETQFTNTFFPAVWPYGLDVENYAFGDAGEPTDSILAQASYAQQIVTWMHGFGRQSALWTGFPSDANGFGTDQLDVAAWQARNNLVASAYRGDWVSWQAYAGDPTNQRIWETANVDQIYPEARRLANLIGGVPVYPILYFYVGGGGVALGTDFVAFQISKLRAAGADGFIIWGAYGVGVNEPAKGAAWDNPPWWPIVLENQ